jgi:hypothetical protein
MNFMGVFHLSFKYVEFTMHHYLNKTEIYTDLKKVKQPRQMNQ